MSTNKIIIFGFVVYVILTIVFFSVSDAFSATNQGLTREMVVSALNRIGLYKDNVLTANGNSVRVTRVNVMGNEDDFVISFSTRPIRE